MSRLLRFAILVITLGSVFGCGGVNSSGSSSTSNSNTVNVGVLNGSYAFLLTGFDANGKPMAIVGSITADGKGDITGGSADVNDDFVVSSGTGLSGSYTLDATYRGSITLANTFGSIAHPLAFAYTMKSNGTFGDIMSLDTNPFTTGGSIQQQTTSAFSLSSIASNYTFELDGFQVASNVANRESTIGRFSLASSGTASSGMLDQSVTGTGPTALSDAAFTAQFNGSGPNSSGRSTLSFILPGSTTANYVYYVVGATRMFLMESDPSTSSSTVQAGVANQQTIPLSAVTGGSVFAIAGVDSGDDVASIGQLVIAATSANLTWDTNDNGKFYVNQTATNQTVGYNASNGRGTITTTSGGLAGSGLFNNAVFYLSGAGQGFLLDTTPGSSAKALAGPIQAQSGVGSFATGTLSANMIVGATCSGGTVSVTNGGTTTSTSDIGAVAGILQLSSTNNFNFIFDQRTVGQADALNKEDTGANFSAVSATAGRAMLTIPPPSGLANSISVAVYMIAPNQFVFVDETPTPSGVANPVPSPVIFFFDPQ